MTKMKVDSEGRIVNGRFKGAQPMLIEGPIIIGGAGSIEDAKRAHAYRQGFKREVKHTPAGKEISFEPVRGGVDMEN